MALGKPIIGSNLGGIPELIDDKESGILFNPLKKGDLKRKINEFESFDVVNLGRKSREKVENIANKEEHYNAIMDIFKKAIKK